MPDCDNPLWPCAMTGAAACLAGFEGLTVIIHGSSGCYYYPATLLHAPLEGTFITENEVIFGSEARLTEVIGNLSEKGKRIAVITTCVPAILGEDIQAILDSREVILVDSPGFAGDVEAGYQRALEVLAPEVDPETAGVNIDGTCLLDPFARGNIREVVRLLHASSVPVGTVFSLDEVSRVKEAAAYTVGTNADFCGGAGKRIGETLGFAAIRETFEKIGDIFGGADPDPVLRELDHEDERVRKACDKFLRKFDPPRVAIFGGSSYSIYAAETLKHYLDAEIAVIGTRNHPLPSRFSIEKVEGLSRARDLIQLHDPDIVLGSSFEQPVSGERGFLGFTSPLRGKVRLDSHALAGISGTLSFMENVLNECMDRKKSPVSDVFCRD